MQTSTSPAFTPPPLEAHELGEDWPLLFAPGTRLLALPSWRCPRLLVPADTLADRWRGSAFYPAFRPGARLYRLLLRGKAASGIRAVRGGAPVTPPLAEFLAEQLPGARVLAVMIGMPGAARKLVAQLIDSRGTVVGYLKCASKLVARQKLRHEYRLLRELPPGIGPIPLKYGSMGGLDALLLAPVAGKLLAPELPPPCGVVDFVASLSTATARPFHDHPWVRESHPAEPPIAWSLAVLSRRSWAVVKQHGDLTPWNMLRTPAGTIAAVDWEDGRSDGFPGLDLAHYLLQVACLVHRWHPRGARDYVVRFLAGQGAVELDLSEAEALAIVTLAAHGAYQSAIRSGHGIDNPTQRWRQAIWEGGA